MNEERNAEIIRRRRAGERPRDIANAMKISKNTVIGVCDRANAIVTRQANPTYTKIVRSLVLATAKKSGAYEAARQWRVAVMTVYRWQKLAQS